MKKLSLLVLTLPILAVPVQGILHEVPHTAEVVGTETEYWSEFIHAGEEKDQDQNTKYELALHAETSFLNGPPCFQS